MPFLFIALREVFFLVQNWVEVEIWLYCVLVSILSSQFLFREAGGKMSEGKSVLFYVIL